MSFFVLLGLSALFGLCIVLSITTNANLVIELRAYDKALNEALGEPRLTGYEWSAWPRNMAYSAWLRKVASDPTSRYYRRARMLKVLRIAAFLLWLSFFLVIVLD